MSASVTSQAVAVLRKDLVLSWRGRARIVAMVSFAVVTLMLFSFAVGPATDVLSKHAGGYLWLALLLSSTLALGQSFQLELEDAALEGLMLLPVDPRALFFGKAAANALQLVVLGVVLVQVLPLPPSVVATVSPGAHDLYSRTVPGYADGEALPPCISTFPSAHGGAAP